MIDNKKIPTWLGVVIIVIFSATAVAFVLVYEKNSKTSGIKNDVAMTQESTPAEKKKEQSNENEDIYYKSDNLGVEFSYKSLRVGKINSFIQEKNNEIKLMVAQEDTERNKEICAENKECQIVDGVIYWPGIGGLNVYEKSTNESIEDAIARVMKQKGGSPSKCVIDSYVDRGKTVYYIKQKKEYVPLNNGDVSAGMIRQRKFTEETYKICALPGNGHFIYTKNESKTKFAFIYGEMMDAPDINEESVKFIK
ncbi:MAG: hypothetical protein WC823_05160 [Parcubacteria group bacterium]|jgi:hypothetical protein